MDEPPLSDHRVIEFRVEGDTTSPPLIRNHRKTYWFPYSNYIKRNLGIGRKGDRQYDLEQISGAIMGAFHSSYPVSMARSSKEAPWWKENLSNLRKEVLRLFNTAKQNNTYKM